MMPGLTRGMMIRHSTWKPVGVQIVAGLDQAEVELLHAGIERQHHERQIDIDHAEQDAPVGEHHLNRLIDDAEPFQNRVDDAFVADNLLHREGADQEIGPERDGDQEEPDVARCVPARVAMK